MYKQTPHLGLLILAAVFGPWHCQVPGIVQGAYGKLTLEMRHTWPGYVLVLLGCLTSAAMPNPTQLRGENEQALTRAAPRTEGGRDDDRHGGRGVRYFGNLALRGGRRGDVASPFSMPGMLAKTKIRELHVKQSQTQREEAMDLARQKARQVMLAAAHQVGAAVCVTEIAAESVTTGEHKSTISQQYSEECPFVNTNMSACGMHEEAQEMERADKSTNKRAPNEHSECRLIPKAASAALTLAPCAATLQDKTAAYKHDDSVWGGGRRVEVYLPEEAQGCIRAMLHGSPPHTSPPRAFPASQRPCREMVLYRPLASKFPHSGEVSKFTAPECGSFEDRGVTDACRIQALSLEQQWESSKEHFGAALSQHRRAEQDERANGTINPAKTAAQADIMDEND